VIGVTVKGERSSGCGVGDGGEGAKFWLGVFTEIKNRGVQDVLIAVCDGLRGLPEAITTTWELATRPGVRHSSDSQHIPVRVPPILGRDEPGPAAGIYRTIGGSARERFAEFAAKWGQQYPAITRLWENAWTEFVPFVDYEVEIRRVICSTNAIESIDARYWRAVRARGHF
jgi:putative transposase